MRVRFEAGSDGVGVKLVPEGGGSGGAAGVGGGGDGGGEGVVVGSESVG